jgi:hypothetical protein
MNGAGDLGEGLFAGPCGGRIQTGGLRDAIHWDEVVTKLGYEQLGCHDLRHTGLAWVTDAGVQLHRDQRVAGPTGPRITRWCVHPDIGAIRSAAVKWSRYLRGDIGPRFAPPSEPSGEKKTPSDAGQRVFLFVGLTGFEPATT